MGYRSEVAIALSCEVYDRAPEKVKDFLYDWFNQTDNSDYVVFHSDSIKWYIHDEEVRSVMDYLLSLDETDYGFIELGEESGDEKYLGDTFSYGLQISRSIVF